MKTATILIIICLFAASMAETSEIKGKLTSLLAMQAQASDAIDSVNDLLKSLK